MGVSGGPDSVALLHALCQLKDELSLEIQVAHLNHMLRGEEADQDASYVSELCQSLAVSCHQLQADVLDFARASHQTVEEAARNVRYSNFAELLYTQNIQLLLVAHNANDQAETVLMRLLRGTGLHGLAGMSPLGPLPDLNINLVLYPDIYKKWLVGRPLLEVWREEIEEYCVTHQLNPRRDSSNSDLNYTRNRVRQELLPLLEEKYQHGAAVNLARLARLAGDEEAWLSELTRQSFCKIAEIRTGLVSLNILDLQTHPLALQRRLLRLAYAEVTGTLHNLDFSQVETVLANLTQAGWKQDLPQGVQVLVKGSQLLIQPTRIGSAQNNLLRVIKSTQLALPGEFEINNWRISAEILPVNEAIVACETGFKAILDAAKVGTEVIIRGRRRGEKFKPLGAPGQRKLQDYMLDAKIPRELRESWPLVVRPASVESEAEKVVWVVGYGIGDEFKVTAETQRILRLSVEQVD